MITFEELLIEDAQMDGYAKGKEEARENIVIGLITKHGFSNQIIADYAEVPIEFVRKVRRSINCKKLSIK